MTIVNCIRLAIFIKFIPNISLKSVALMIHCFIIRFKKYDISLQSRIRSSNSFFLLNKTYGQPLEKICSRVITKFKLARGRWSVFQEPFEPALNRGESTSANFQPAGWRIWSSLRVYKITKTSRSYRGRDRADLCKNQEARDSVRRLRTFRWNEPRDQKKKKEKGTKRKKEQRGNVIAGRLNVKWLVKRPSFVARTKKKRSTGEG